VVDEQLAVRRQLRPGQPLPSPPEPQRGKPEPKARLIVLVPAKALEFAENDTQLLRRNTQPGIVNANLELIARAANTDGHASLLRVLDGI